MPERALPPRATAMLLALVAGLLLLRLGALPLLGPDEPRYARVAVEMHRSGDLVTPTLQGRPWLEKPVLYYWLAGLGFTVLGENEWAARLPSVAAALLLVGVTALFGARLFGAAVGLHSGFVLGTSLMTFVYGRAAAMDMLLAACVTAALGLLALRLLGIAGRTAVVGAHAFLALATLAKGPLGVLLPGLVVAGYAIVRRDARVLKEVLAPAGLATFAVVALPWYALAYQAQGQAFVDVFLLNHNLQRFTSTIHNHPGPFYYYLPVLLLGLFPWSGLALPGVLGLRPRRSAADAFVAVWLLLPLLFFSLAASKLPGYILPCLPPLALAAGRAAAGMTQEARWPWARPVALVGVVLGALLAAAPFVLRAQGEPRWLTLLPACMWALVVLLGVSRLVERRPLATLALWRVGAAGFLLLLVMAAPPLLAARESGRALFLPAAGRPVLAWGAWRTAWMAGYFYNDAKVREIDGFPELQSALDAGPVLVLAGPGERRRLERMPGLRTTALAPGPRGNVLLKVERTPAGGLN
jgi:4-amino-4-deoxy-L-arabinose transferase-like glycosyltransferase